MSALIVAAFLALAPQQNPPVAEAGRVCAPRDAAAAVACLDQHLTPAAKTRIAATAAKNMTVERVALGAWVRNNWGLWSNGPLAVFFITKGVLAPEPMSDRIIDGYWLKAHGCALDWNDLAKVNAAMALANADRPPCPAA